MLMTDIMVAILTTAVPVVRIMAATLTRIAASNLVATAGVNMFATSLATKTAGSVLMNHVIANNAAADMYLSTMKYSAADGFLSTTAKHAAQLAQSTTMLTVVFNCKKWVCEQKCHYVPRYYYKHVCKPEGCGCGQRLQQWLQ